MVDIRAQRGPVGGDGVDHVLHENERLRALVGLHFGDADPGLQAGKAQQAQRQDHHRDEDFQQRKASCGRIMGVRIFMRIWAGRWDRG